MSERPDQHGAEEQRDAARRDADFDAALSPGDESALEALIDAGYEVSRVPEQHRARAERLAAMLGLLDAPLSFEGRDETDEIMAKLRDHARPLSVSLSGDDVQFMELNPPEREIIAADARATRHASLRALVVSKSPVIAFDQDLCDRTFDLIMLAEESQRRLRMPVATGGGSRWTWRELVTIAATLLLGASVILPLLAAGEHRARRLACTGNLRDVAGAMGQYANQYRDSMPIATASLGGGGGDQRWWNVGTSSSNSANLYTLVRGGFASLRALACPGNPSACCEMRDPSAIDWKCLDEVSFSYQIQKGSESSRLREPSRTAVLADRSPVVRRAVAGGVIYPFENSCNHGRQGQDVLFADGSVVWHSTPVLSNGDNIWLPRAIEEQIRAAMMSVDPTLKGVETPESSADAFLGP
ncbi:MAG: hypothetical protein IT434_09715 [Phycisphaerales bacterium]|jgi:hypothetical protein|nr:hypothetical protein [Phycisphaerales bacterium]